MMRQESALDGGDERRRSCTYLNRRNRRVGVRTGAIYLQVRRPRYVRAGRTLAAVAARTVRQRNYNVDHVAPNPPDIPRLRG